MYSHFTYQNIAFEIEIFPNIETVQDGMQQFSCISHNSHSDVSFCVCVPQRKLSHSVTNYQEQEKEKKLAET